MTEPTETPATAETPKFDVPRLKFLSEAFIKTNPTASARSCFVLGATGETGRRVASILIESGAFSLIRLIVRRQLADEYLPEPQSGVKIVKRR